MTTKSGLAPVHPGEILGEELNEIGLSASALARAIDVPVNRITAILNGSRGITADTALRLSRYFDTTARFWLNLQQTWQIRQAEIDAGTHILERIIPRQTEALREAARAAREMQNVSTSAFSAFRTIENNLALCDQLRAFERSLRILDKNRQISHAFEGPLDELRRAGIFETTLRQELSCTQQWLADYNSRFRVPASAEVSRLLAELQTTSKVVSGTSALQHTIESMKSPWLDIRNELDSVRRLFELQNIGELIRREAAFDPAVANTLRASLGDWRDAITWPNDIWTDLGARTEFYVGLGFDVGLTDMPASAFREAAMATIQSEPPTLVHAYGPPVTPTRNTGEEQALARTHKAHDWLRRLESQLRRFIDTEMTRAFGGDWPRHQIPDHKYEEWMSKQEEADHAGTPSCPLITYADFDDYVLIVCRQDNWEQVFNPVFDRPESIRESFQRLRPIHHDTMYSRPITLEDELLLNIESRRIMQPIAAH